MKKIVSYIVSILILVSVLPLNAFAESAVVKSGTTGDCTWMLDGTVLTISGKGRMQNYESPTNDAPWGKKISNVVINDGVTYISDYAFFGSNIESITLPDTVISIGKSSFSRCHELKSIAIPTSILSIGSDAFNDCWKLEKVYITDLVKWLNINFNWCSNPLSSLSHCGYGGASLYLNGKMVESIVIPNTMVEIKDYVLEGCSTIKSIIIPNSIKSIGAYAFAYCSNLTSVTIPDSVESIGYWAFSQCNIKELNIAEDSKSVTEKMVVDEFYLEKVRIPDSVTSIESNAFDKCTKLKQVDITDISKWCSIKFNNSRSNPLCYGADLYLNGAEVENLTVPDTLKKVNDYAFYGCTSIKNLTIPDGIKNTGISSFENCTNIKNITLSDSLEGIGFATFKNCYNVTDINFGNGIITIGDCAFNNCRNLSKIIIPNSVTNIGHFAFEDCISLKYATISENLTDIKNGTFKNCRALTGVNIPDGVTDIGDSAFSQCFALANTNIPNNVVNIGDSAFSQCFALTNINIPNSVVNIGNSAFSKCTKLMNVSLSTSLKKISENTFKDCTALKEITIPYSVTTIGTQAFYDCTELTSITMPDSVTSIGKNAFFGCKIKELNIAEGSKEVTSEMIVCESTLEKVTIPDSVENIGDTALSGCTKLTEITIPDSVKAIGKNAFSGCTGLEKVYITDMAAWCNIKFSNSGSNPLCYAHNLYLNDELLTNIVIPNGVASIGNYAFSGCTDLVSINIPSSVTSIGKDSFSDVDKSRFIIYTDSINSAAYKYANDNAYLCRVLVNDAGNINFSLEDNVLRVFGTGKTPNYNLFTSTPWYDFKDNITKIIIDKSITEIGTYSFYGFDNLKIIETENPNLKFNTRSINTGNKNISVYSTGSGTLEEYCNNNSVNFVKPPETPVLSSVTEDTIEVQNENGFEYSLDKINWQESGMFKELKPVTQYTVYVRRKNGNTPFEGKPLVVTTTKRIIAAPVSPTVEGYASNSVTLKPGYEYSLDGINWQHSNVFDNLLLNKIYTLYQRTIENDTDFCSKSSEALYFSLPDKPEIIKIGATTLAVKEIEGYEYSLDKIDWQSSAVFTGLINNMKYTVYQRISKSLYPNSYQITSAGTEVYLNGSDKIVPKAPQAPIIDNLTNNAVVLKAMPNYEYKMDNGEWQSSNVFIGLAPNSTHKFYQRIAETDTAYASEPSEALTVTTLKNTVNAPSAPTVLSKTANSITLKDISGYEYSADGKVWQKSNVFTGLTEDTEYTFYQRIAETDTTYVSESSAPLKVKTDKSYTPGDLDGDEGITDSDVLYLLKHTFRPEKYPVNQPCDYNGDGEITDADAVYLLKHIFRPEKYPLTK